MVLHMQPLSGFKVLILDLTEDTAKKGLEKIHRLLEKILRTISLQNKYFMRPSIE